MKDAKQQIEHFVKQSLHAVTTEQVHIFVRKRFDPFAILRQLAREERVTQQTNGAHITWTA